MSRQEFERLCRSRFALVALVALVALGFGSVLFGAAEGSVIGTTNVFGDVRSAKTDLRIAMEPAAQADGR